MPWAISAHFGTSTSRLMEKMSKMLTVATTLVLRATALWCCQCTMGGPNVGCSISQVCSRSDPRLNANAANSKNGVVGTSGKTIPKIPAPTQVQPSAIQKYRFKTPPFIA